jgi:hypothetical protein
MDQMIGFAINTEVQILLGVDEATIQENQNEINKLNKEHLCYAQIADVMYAQITNKKLMTQYIIDAKNIGELEALKKSAYTVYNTQKENGFNPNFDPKDCQLS